MGKLLYRTGIGLYGLLVTFLSLFNEKAKLFAKGRKGWEANLQKALAGNTKKTVWFHCASLGEFEQARPVIEKYREEFPNTFLLVTFFSPSGYEIRKDYDQADYVCYLPLDTPANAQKFVETVSPSLVFFVKYEFWYFYLQAVNQRNIPLISFSAIFRPEQLFFKSYGNFYRQSLQFFTHFFVQDEKSVELLHSIDIEKVTQVGDTRYDRVKEVFENRKEIPLAKAFKNGAKTMVVGSSWPQDIEAIAEMYEQFDNPLKLLIAPHEIGESNIKAVEKAFSKNKITRFSQADLATVANSDILIIDNIGMLSSLYQYGEFAFIGGAFEQGLHNTLEAATYGVPVFFGPEYVKFQEAFDLIDCGGGFSIKNGEDFLAQFSKLYENEKAWEKAAKASFDLVRKNVGATEKVIAFSKSLSPSTKVQ